jgi:hypothetical protein
MVPASDNLQPVPKDDLRFKIMIVLHISRIEESKVKLAPSQCSEKHRAEVLLDTDLQIGKAAPDLDDSFGNNASGQRGQSTDPETFTRYAAKRRNLLLSALQLRKDCLGVTVQRFAVSCWGNSGNGAIKKDDAKLLLQHLYRLCQSRLGKPQAICRRGDASLLQDARKIT